MKGGMFDVVVYITRNYGAGGAGVEDPGEIREELLGAGFEEDDVERALAWLERLRNSNAAPAAWAQARPAAVRVPTGVEAVKLSADARGFLMRLEAAGILDGRAREAVYERVVGLDVAEVGLEEARVLAALVLKARPGVDPELVAHVLTGNLDAIYH